LKTMRDKKLAKRLIYAAEGGDSSAVVAAVDAGARVNALEADVSAMPAWPAGAALHWAAVNADEPMMRFLIEKGADVELRTAHGKTPLLIAAEALSVTGCRVLLEAGADPDAVGPVGETALHVVAWEMSGGVAPGAGALRSRGYFEAEAVAAVLLQKGARTDIKTHAGMTALDTHRPSVGVMLGRMRDDFATVGTPARRAGPSAGP
jgi:hypothetical protein